LPDAGLVGDQSRRATATYSQLLKNSLIKQFRKQLAGGQLVGRQLAGKQLAGKQLIG
jgi:hypothetical protein